MRRRTGRSLDRQDLHVVLAEIARMALDDLEPRAMQQRITDALARHFEWEFVALVRVDHESQRFVCEALSTALPTDIYVGYSRPLGSGVVGRAAASGRPVLISDARDDPDFVHTLPGGQSELAVPIRHREQVVGVLNLESRRVGAFDDQLELLSLVAEQIAGAIHAARQHAELQRRNELLEFAAQLTRDALSAGDLSALLERVLRHLERHFGTAEATVLLESELKDHLEVMAHHGASPHITRLGKQWPVASGIVGRCFRLGEMQHLQDVRRDPEYSVVNPRVQSEVAVPIRFRERVFGVLNLESEDPEAFDALNRAMLRMLADQLGGAIHLMALNRRLSAQGEWIQQQDQRLASTRESLKRAVGKLHRRRGTDPETGLPGSEALLRKFDARRRRARSRKLVQGLGLLSLSPEAELNRHLEALETWAAKHGQLLLRWNAQQLMVMTEATQAELIEQRWAASELPEPWRLRFLILAPNDDARAESLLAHLDVAAHPLRSQRIPLGDLVQQRRGRGRPPKPR